MLVTALCLSVKKRQTNPSEVSRGSFGATGVDHDLRMIFFASALARVVRRLARGWQEISIRLSLNAAHALSKALSKISRSSGSSSA